MTNNQIEHSLIEAIAPGVLDNVVAAGEIAVDSVLEEGILKDIPVLSTIIRLYKAGVGVKDVLFLKKVNRFLTRLQSIPEEERQKFMDSMNADPKQKQRAGETLLMVLERLDDMEKPDLVAKAFVRFMREEIDLETLRRICLAIDRCFLSDLQYLAVTGRDQQIPQAAALILASCGLMEVATVPTIRGAEASNKYQITEFGEKFRAVVIEE